MASSDWPDYTHGVVLSTGGSVTDCPDWQEQVVAPGGGAIGGGVANYVDYVGGLAMAYTTVGATLLSGSGLPITPASGAKKWLAFSLVVQVILTTTAAAGSDGVQVKFNVTSGLVVGDSWSWVPGVIVTGALLTATLSGEMYTHNGVYIVDIQGQGTGSGTGQIGNGGGLSIFGTWPDS